MPKIAKTEFRLVMAKLAYLKNANRPRFKTIAAVR
jgi:hypothetical protein